MYKTLTDLMGEHVIGYLSAVNDKHFAMLYPQYVFANGVFEPICREDIFPDVGAISVVVHDLVGDCPVVIKINNDYLELNNHYNPIAPENGSDVPKTRYFCRCGLSYGGDAAAIQIYPLFNHPLSSHICQLMTLDSNFNKYEPDPTPILFRAGEYPYVDRILVKRPGEDRAYGPFLYETKSNGSFVLRSDKGFDYRVAELEDIESVQILNSFGRPSCSVTSLDVVRSKHDSLDSNAFVDWIPESVLIEQLNAAMTAGDTLGRLSAKQLKALKDGVLANIADEEIIKIDERRQSELERLMTNFETLLDRDIALSKKLYMMLKNSLTDDAMIGRIIKNPELCDAIISRSSSNAGLRKRIQEFEAHQKEALRELDESIQHKTEEIGLLDQEILDLQEKKEQVVKVEFERAQGEHKRLSDEVANLKRVCMALEQTKSSLELEVSDLEERLNPQAIKERLLEDEIIRSLVVTEDKKSATQPSTTLGIEEVLTKHQSPTISLQPADLLTEIDLLEQAEDLIYSRAGRTITRLDLINYFTCIAQGLITTFAGTPGTGKTSLCRLLAQSMGLDHVQSRYREIYVENGWTSHKDYIAYYNPLTGSIERANPEIFDTMVSLSVEDSKKCAPFIYILDEANLSPIEHYWSPFLRMCDNIEAGLDLPLGGNAHIRLPEHIRFLATVNFDHTTEELSPRFLDRSWVITLDPEKLEDARPQRSVDASDIAPISYHDFMRAFGRQRAQALEHKGLSAYDMDKIFDVFKLAGKPISQRSQSMVRDYVCLAGSMMRQAGSDKIALDNAVAQKLLPHISDTPDKLEKLWHFGRTCTRRSIKTAA